MALGRVGEGEGRLADGSGAWGPEVGLRVDV